MKWATYITVTLIIVLIAMVVGSWIVSAVMPEVNINSMLSGEGIRWYVGHLTDILATHVLAWILLTAMAVGAAKECGISKAFTSLSRHQQLDYYERLGLQTAIITACILIGVVTYLIVAPDAVLLGATGSLFPSAFATGFVAIACFIATTVCATYGFTARTFPTLTAFFTAMCRGVNLFAPLIMIYIIAAQLTACAIYIFTNI